MTSPVVPRPGDGGRPVGGRRRVLWASLAAAVVLAVLVAVLASRPPVAATQAQSPLLGRPAPALSGPGLSGSRVSLAAFRGRFVLVNFFASWCEPCHQEARALVALSASVPILGVVYDDQASSAARFMASSGAGWPALLDPDGQAAVSFGVRGPPESYLITPEGTVAAKVVGPIGPAQEAYLRQVMDRLARSGQ